MLLLKSETILLLLLEQHRGTSAGNDDVRTAAKTNNCMLTKNPSLQNGYLSEKFTLERPKTSG